MFMGWSVKRKNATRDRDTEFVPLRNLMNGNTAFKFFARIFILRRKNSLF